MPIWYNILHEIPIVRQPFRAVYIPGPMAITTTTTEKTPIIHPSDKAIQ